MGNSSDVVFFNSFTGTWRSGPDDIERALQGRSFASVPAVMKCSVPFPGVIQGRRVGDGLAIGDVEARVLATIPSHPNVVKLLAGEFLFTSVCAIGLMTSCFVYSFSQRGTQRELFAPRRRGG